MSLSVISITKALTPDLYNVRRLHDGHHTWLHAAITLEEATDAAVEEAGITGESVYLDHRLYLEGER